MAPMDGVESATSSLSANTIYARNIDERIKIPKLTETLREVFETFGEVVDIVAKKSLKRKGQAFIVFADAESAALALEEIQGFELFGKPLQLHLAKVPSDETVKRNGTEAEFEQHKRRRLTAKERKQAMEAEEALKKPARAEPAKPRAKIAATADEHVPPNNTLFLQNLPDDVDLDALNVIYEEFDGFKEVRYAEGMAIAFVEFDQVLQAVTAKDTTANMPVGAQKQPMKVTFGRK